MQDNMLIFTIAAVAACLGLICVFMLIPPRRVLLLLQTVAAYLPSPIGLAVPPVPSLAVVSAIGTAYSKRSSSDMRTRGVRALLMILVVVAITHLTASASSASFFDSLRWIVWPAGMASVILLAERSTKRNSISPDELLAAAVKVLQPFLIIQSIAVTLFRLSPDLKLQYLRSPVGNFLTGGRSSLLWAGLPDNVLLDDKSGGLWFVNANEGSMALGVCGLLCLGLTLRRGFRMRLGLTSSVLAFIGVAMSGSRTAVVLLLTLPAAVFFLGNLIERAKSGIKFALMVLGSPALVVGALWISSVVSDVFTSADVSTNSRFRLWDAAWTTIQSHTLFGIGFGNWPAVWAPYAVLYAEPLQLPPHNFLLEEWVQSGAVSALAVLLLFLTPILLGLARVRRVGVDYLILGKVAAVAWVFTHGMFDATPFWGTPMLAVILPLSMWSLCRPSSTRERDDVGLFGSEHPRRRVSNVL